MCIRDSECATLTPLFGAEDAQGSLDAIREREPRLLTDMILGFPLALSKVCLLYTSRCV